MDGRTLLLNELTQRRIRNPAYSLRAFARDLGVSPAALSQFLNRKRDLSRKNAESVREHLHLSPAEGELFQVRRGVSSIAPRATIQEDQFRLISDWVSLAILNLALLKGSRASAGWISARLGIPAPDARAALKRLVRLKLVKTKGGGLARTGRPFATTQDVPSAAIQRFHLDVLQKAEASLLETPVPRRDVTAIVMPLDPGKLAEAKQLIRRTRHRIAKLVSGSGASEVYVLSVQLFPLSKVKDDGNVTKGT